MLLQLFILAGFIHGMEYILKFKYFSYVCRTGVWIALSPSEIFFRYLLPDEVVKIFVYKFS